MSELWRDLICIPLMLSNSPQSPEQSIVRCSSETSHAPPMADISLIISRMSLYHFLFLLMKHLTNCVPVLFHSFFFPKKQHVLQRTLMREYGQVYAIAKNSYTRGGELGTV